MKKPALGVYASVVAGLVGLSACASAPLTITAVNTLPATQRAPASKVDVLYAQGREALVAGDLASALELFHGARRSGPEDIRVLNGLAVIYDRLGRYDLSANYYDRARDLDPNSEVLQANLTLSNQMRSRQNQGGRQEFAQQLAPMAGVPTSASEKPDWVVPSSLDVVVSDPAIEAVRAGDVTKTARITFGPPQIETPPAAPLNSIAVISMPAPAMQVIETQPSAHQGPLRQPLMQVSGGDPSSSKPNWSRPAIVVINGSGVRGQARSTATALRQTGWVVTRVGNELPFARAHTIIIYGVGQRQQALMVAQAIAGETGQTPALSQRLWHTQIQVRLGRDTVAPRRQGRQQI